MRPSRRHRITRWAALGAACLGIIVAASPAGAVPPGWSPPKQLLAQRFGPQHSMAVDSTGHIHIVAEGLSSDGLWYLSNAGGMGWFKIHLTHGIDLDPSIAVDGADRVHIAFDRRKAGSLDSKGIWTATNATGTFVVAKALGGEDYRPSIAVHGGTTFIAYQSAPDSLILADDAGGGSFTGVSVAGHCCAGAPSLALTSQGAPHIAYSRVNAGAPAGLRLASGDGGGWYIQTVDAHPTRDPSLVVLHGLPSMAYIRGGHDTLFATPSQSGWAHLVVGAGYDFPPDLVMTEDFTIEIAEGRTARLALYKDDGTSTTTVITHTGIDFDPELIVYNGHAGMLFDRASGTTADGIWFTRER